MQDSPASTSSVTALPAGTRLHEFEIVRVAGVGGFSIVYLALDQQLHRQVALKEYIPATLAARAADQQVTVISGRDLETFRLGLLSFVNEARLLAAFDHPSLIKVYRFWEQNGTAYMVMPYYAAPTLSAVLRSRTEPPDEAWLKRLLAPLLDALQVLHAGHCYHRDISPDNILMLGPTLAPLLLDFGAARRVIGNASQALTAILKPGYAPIEQYVESGATVRQGAWTDIYALCAVLYTAITGRIPIASVARAMDDELEPLRNAAQGRYSAAFLKAIDHGLALRPEHRPQDIATLRAELFAAPASAPVELPVLNDAATLPPRSPAPDATLAPVAPTAPISPIEPTEPTEPTEPIARPEPIEPTLPAPPPRAAPARRLAPWAAAALALASVVGLGVWWRGGPARVEPAASALPVTTARGEFGVVAVLDEIVRGADPATSVVALADQSSVRIGQDDIRLKVTSNQGGYLYVLFSGTGEPEIRLLYPNERDRDHRIEAGAEVTLPSAASKLRMTASGPPGVDHLVAIVSPTPRRFDAVGLHRVSSAAFDLPQFDLARAAQLWAVAPAGTTPYAGAPDCAASQPCPGGYGAAVLKITEIAPGN